MLTINLSEACFGEAEGRAPGSQGWAGGRAEQTSKQATPTIGLWFFFERLTLTVLETKANGRRTTDKEEATTDQGLQVLALGQESTDKRHIFWDYPSRGT